MSEKRSREGAGHWVVVFGLGLAAGWALAAWLSRDEEQREKLRKGWRDLVEGVKGRLSVGWEAGQEAARRAREGDGRGQE